MPHILVAVPHRRGFLDPSPAYQSLSLSPLEGDRPPGLDPVLLKGLASSKPAGHPLSAQICTLVAPRGTHPFPGTCNRSLPVTSPPVSEPMSVISLVWPVHASPAGSVLGLDAAVGCNAQGYTPRARSPPAPTCPVCTSWTRTRGQQARSHGIWGLGEGRGQGA